MYKVLEWIILNQLIIHREESAAMNKPAFALIDRQFVNTPSARALMDPEYADDGLTFASSSANLRHVNVASKLAALQLISNCPCSTVFESRHVETWWSAVLTSLANEALTKAITPKR
ncbi:hypothetical protein RB195_014004 [Necator americanus]|uniref:Uncharacterized protein n=1 Tax=Necator americanus TaxID=51031 RepID=A0ABR1DZC9_NECAM